MTVTSDFRPEVEMLPFRAYAMHPAIIIRSVCSLWMWLWDRCYVPQNVFLVYVYTCLAILSKPSMWTFTEVRCYG